MGTDFDERAATWDHDPDHVERAHAVADRVRAHGPLGAEIRLLEYGAGTGLVSQFLAADVGPVTLAEPSDGMRGVIADKIDAGTLPPDTRVWDLDLARDAVPVERFDLVVTVMTLHHIGDLDRVLRAFAALLDEDGRLFVADLDEEDGTFHDPGHDFDGHEGFDRDDFARRLADAGFAARFETCYEITKDDRTYPLFMAVAER